MAVTPEYCQRILTDYINGVHTTEIVKRYRISTETLTKLVIASGTRLRSERARKEKLSVVQMREMLDGGATLTQVALMCGTTAAVIRKLTQHAYENK